EHHLDTRIPVATSDELGQLAQAFNEMATALQNYEYQRQQWLADTAHELRTPLSILKGEIEALEDGVRPFDQNSLASLHQETTRLQRIVEDLRLINHLELGKLELFLRPLELNKLVTEALKQAQTRLEAAKVKVNWVPTQAELSINGDYDRLHQVLLNLMENTARHAPESNLDIRSGFDQNEVVLLLGDNGPGVSEVDLPHLFDRFYRTEQSRNRVSGGSGLGLAICQELMQAHQGRISARRGSFGGLEIELRWPLLEKKNE
ncbi:MAG: ATP-binding protein, partial [bacterium]